MFMVPPPGIASGTKQFMLACQIGDQEPWSGPVSPKAMGPVETADS